VDGFNEAADEPSGVHVDQFEGLVFVEALEVVEETASGLEELAAAGLVEHVWSIAGGDVVVVLVIAQFFEAAGVGWGSGFGGAPKDGVSECPSEEVGGFVGLGAADDELEESGVAGGQMWWRDSDHGDRLGLAVIVEAVDEEAADGTAQGGAVFNWPSLGDAEAREVVLANLGQESGEKVGQNGFHGVGGAVGVAGLRNLTYASSPIRSTVKRTTSGAALCQARSMSWLVPSSRIFC